MSCIFTAFKGETVKHESIFMSHNTDLGEVKKGSVYDENKKTFIKLY